MSLEVMDTGSRLKVALSDMCAECVFQLGTSDFSLQSAYSQGWSYKNRVSESPALIF